MADGVSRLRRGGRLLAPPLDGRAPVELDAGEACRRCARGVGCGAALFTPRARPLRLDCEVPERLAGVSGGDGSTTLGRLAPGTRVTVEIDASGSGWLWPVLLAYGLPTLGLLGGALVPEPWTPLTAVAGLVGGLLAWRFVAAHDATRSATGSPNAPALASGPSPCAARITSVEHFESTGEPP